MMKQEVFIKIKFIDYAPYLSSKSSTNGVR